MKRCLSIIITVMLILSNFVTVLATDDSFSVIEVDDKINYSFNKTFDGYIRISADVYIAQGVTDELVPVKEVGGEYCYKIFVFNTVDELKPLADMQIKTADSE